MRRATSLGAAAILAAILSGGAALSAHAAPAEPPPYTLVFDQTTATFTYGDYWYVQATATGAGLAMAPFVVTGSLTGAPSGYTPSVSTYLTNGNADSVAYIGASASERPLPAGSYIASLTLSPFNGAAEGSTTNPTASIIIAPAALTVALQAQADPSNPANAIVSARFTGPFLDNYFTSSDPTTPLTPAGTWKIEATDAEGQVVHEFSAARIDTDAVLATSTYWPDVPAGEYTIKASFTTTGASSQNFTITDATPITYTASPAPGATSTASPAPPAPPASEDAGLTLPLWIPLVAGVFSAGLLALMIVQIVRLRRAGIPAGTTDGPEVAA
jgi:hypothetical protein